MKIKIINFILIFISIFCSFCYSVNTIINGDIYGTLIRLSIVPIIILPYLLKKIFKFNISTYSETIYIVFIFLSHFLGSIVNLYKSIYWYDSFTHFLSGIVVFFYGLEFLIITNKYDKKDMWFNVLFLMALSFMVAGLWEIFEFTCDDIFGKDAQKVIETGVTDTMKDIIMAVLGSSLCALFYYREYKEKNKNLFKNFIKNIK